MTQNSNEIIITKENYKQKLSDLYELRLKQYELKNNKDVNDTKSIVRLFDMLDERPNVCGFYDGRQNEIDGMSEEIDIYIKAFERYITAIDKSLIQKEKEKAGMQERILEYRDKIAECESNIARLDVELQDDENLKNEIHKGLSKKPHKGMDFLLIPDEVQKGNTILFGSYTHDQNGKIPIEWIVLDIQEGKLLLTSKYALDCQQYNTEYEDVTWETCSLRKWLNEEFVNNAFSIDEQKLIQGTIVTADRNPSYNTDMGEDTNDKVFLFSINEVNKYFASDEERKCRPTAYAVRNGASRGRKNKNCIWWLRSLGGGLKYAAYVDRGGMVYDYGTGAYHGYGVRPALWIDLEYLI